MAIGCRRRRIKRRMEASDILPRAMKIVGHEVNVIEQRMDLVEFKQAIGVNPSRGGDGQPQVGIDGIQLVAKFPQQQGKVVAIFGAVRVPDPRCAGIFPIDVDAVKESSGGPCTTGIIGQG